VQPTFDNAALDRGRLPLVDAIRAVLATTIAWHHFVLYGPLADLAPPQLFDSFEWLRSYRWAVQPFFVVGGFVMARQMVPRTWDFPQALAFLGRRYCRLGLPYLAAIACAILACALARGELPEEVIGSPPSGKQVLAHVFFLQDILGYPALSAGLWFVCIDFQLSVMLVALLFLRDAGRGRHGPDWAFYAPGWLLALASLFYFNLHPEYDAWGLYYFAHFFLGVLLAKVVGSASRGSEFAWFLAMMAVALMLDWRWRIAIAMLTGAGLFASAKAGLIERWPRSRIVAYLGRTSYSLFLIHFPVLIVVETVWMKLGWTLPWSAFGGLIAAYVVSLIAAEAFYVAVEMPAWRASRRCQWRTTPAAIN
jgi:peptidoglycan/LPS O-acetylase OafA/YrhL